MMSEACGAISVWEQILAMSMVYPSPLWEGAGVGSETGTEVAYAP
jgi:hypothetical protein